MTKYQDKYRIESARLPHWDYANPGMYFITICTKNFQHWFGDVVDGNMILNEMGGAANSYWEEIPDHFDNVELDEYVVMPNHVHGIICITDAKTRPTDERMTDVKTQPPLTAGKYVDASKDVACNVSTPERMANISPKPKSLSTIIRSYKSAVTKSIRKTHNPNFGWHPRFYDHVIRNGYSLEKIQYYIQMNPENWNIDRNVIEEDKGFISKLKVKP